MASFILPIVSGLAGLFGGGRQARQQTQQTQQTNQSQTQQGNYNNFSTSTPNLSPYQQALANLFTQGAGQQYGSAVNLSPYSQVGLQGIAGQGQANNTILNNILASRGLSFSPAGANPLMMNTINTGNQMSNFLSQIPLLSRQLQSQSLGQLMDAFKTLPLSVTQTGGGTQYQTGSSSGTSTGTGQVDQFGNPMGGAFGGLLSGLGAPRPTKGTNLGGILQALGIG